jgi:hypothetical protein
VGKSAKWERRGTALAWAHPKKARRGEERGGAGRVRGLRFHRTEREREERLERWEKELTSGPRLSERERKGRGSRLGLGPGRKKGARGWALQAENEWGGIGGERFFSFFKPIFKYIFKLRFLTNLSFCFFKTIISIKMHQHVCNKKNVILNLY